MRQYFFEQKLFQGFFVYLTACCSLGINSLYLYDISVSQINFIVVCYNRHTYSNDNGDYYNANSEQSNFLFFRKTFYFFAHNNSSSTK